MDYTTNVAQIKAYHDALWKASVEDKDKMTITSIIATLISENYQNFEIDYFKLLTSNKDVTPSQALVNLGLSCLSSLKINEKLSTTIKILWQNMAVKNTLNIVNAGTGELNIIYIIESFIKNCLPHIKASNKAETADFLGKIFAELNGKGAKGKTGIVLTPAFLTDFMTDLLQLDYKHDVILDAACGSGSFLVMAYMKMLAALEADYAANKVTPEEYEHYRNRLTTALYGNDIDEQMSLLCLINFILLGIDISNVSLDDCFNLDGEYFDAHQINKGILNPPFEYDPTHFASYLIGKIKANQNISAGAEKRFVMICPPQSFNKNKAGLNSILNLATLEAVISVQSDAFIESNINYGTSIFVFNLNHGQTATDKVIYYDFTDSGLKYYKDSGLVDKYDTFKTKKQQALEQLKALETTTEKNNRTFDTFFDIDAVSNFSTAIDPQKILMNDIEECDLTKENKEMLHILNEKKELLNSVNNTVQNTDSFEKYIINYLSEAL